MPVGEAPGVVGVLAVEADVPHRREHLAGLLWPEQSDDAARTSLRQALRQLHQAFGDDLAPFLCVTPQTIQFNTSSDCQLDVTEFAALIHACDQHPHRQRETAARASNVYSARPRCIAAICSRDSF